MDALCKCDKASNGRCRRRLENTGSRSLKTSSFSLRAPLRVSWQPEFVTENVVFGSTCAKTQPLMGAANSSASDGNFRGCDPCSPSTLKELSHPNDVDMVSQQPVLAAVEAPSTAIREEAANTLDQSRCIILNEKLASNEVPFIGNYVRTARYNCWNIVCLVLPTLARKKQLLFSLLFLITVPLHPTRQRK